ncbi:MAG: hypothetical protein SVV67_02530 [Bacillota bacterium]|nr:hypothetical protein [Bacillota bacterium]
MEGFSFLIVLIILINLVATLMKVIKGRKSNPAPKTSSVGERAVLSDHDVTTEAINNYGSTLLGEVVEAKTDHGVPYGEWVYDEDDKEPDEPSGEDFGEEMVIGEEQSSGEESEEPELPEKEIKDSPAFTESFRQVLTDKDSLVAAIAFHEVMGPPVSLRKRR